MLRMRRRTRLIGIVGAALFCAAVSGVAVVLAGGGSGGFVGGPERFRGKLLHYTLMSHSWLRNGPDPFNDQDVFGDVWVLIDATGVPTHARARYETADGNLVQLIQDTPEGGEFYLGEPGTKTARNCATAAVPASSEAARFVPIFVDKQALPGAGFHPGGDIPTATAARAPSAPPPGLRRVEVFRGPAGAVERWTRSQEGRGGGWTEAAVLAVDGKSGRLVADWSSGTTDAGEVVTHSAAMYGVLEVYEGSDAAAAIFQPAAGEVGCK
ncbi:MAG: hypothetical protein IT304_05190 [Dehalococcoidia bacterium]|nr:hypothetical protein [Dehalococcoidia bacterium]